jgi:hypothetical protein
MPLFSVLVSGDIRLLPAQYPFVRVRLNLLLSNRLPDVRVITGAGPGIDALAERWGDEHGLPVERFPGGRNAQNIAQYVEWSMGMQPDAVVIFDAGGLELHELRRRANVKGLPVRIVDVRRYVHVHR